MAYKLTWQEDRYVYRIGWEDEGGCMDAMLGEDSKSGTGKPPKNREDREHWAANKAARELTPNRDDRAFLWETKREVVAALATIKLALKQERPLPEWAKRALAAGWKAPKGWKA